MTKHPFTLHTPMYPPHTHLPSTHPHTLPFTHRTILFVSAEQVVGFVFCNNGKRTRGLFGIRQCDCSDVGNGNNGGRLCTHRISYIQYSIFILVPLFSSVAPCGCRTPLLARQCVLTCPWKKNRSKIFVRSVMYVCSVL